jgi:hypothetical protein
MVPKTAAILAAGAELPTGSAAAGALTAISIQRQVFSDFICGPSAALRAKAAGLAQGSAIASYRSAVFENGTRSK